MKLGQHMTEEQRAKMFGNTSALGHTPWNKGVHTGKPAWNRGITTNKPAWNRGIPISEEARLKESVSKTNPSAEIRAKMSAAHKGLPTWNKGILGRHSSLETRAKQSAANMGHKASPETRKKLSGALNHSWQGGITPINASIRTSPEYAVWRTAVFERDAYTCQECHQIGGDLEAHHIHEFAQYPDERFVVENGKTLCLECHNKTKGRRQCVAVIGG